MRQHLLPLLFVGAIARSAHAADLNVNVELPRLDTAEYHRPYVAIWIESADQSTARDLAVWYDVAKRNNAGTQWLKDLRLWWRRSGRDQQMPVDGVSGATRPAGKHELSFAGAAKPLADLKPGSYAVVVEAARESGGHELVRVPFDWPPKQASQPAAQGHAELGAIALDIKP
ncbi:MAG TPA: DUF2271 domain-containing protein [Bordetella sp.]